MTARTDTERSRWIALVVLCVGVLMIVLDATVVNVALPAIQDDLGFSQSGLAWVVNAYLIAFGGLLLLAGRLGDLAGRRTVFLAGLAVFSLASAACGAADSEEMLVIARFVQGAGGALTSAVILGMIVTMFPEPREQAKAIGVYGFVATAGGSIGLLAGGVITQAVSWHWIFLVNVPIGVVTAILALRLLAHDEGIGVRAGADVPGAVLITSALMLLVYDIVGPQSIALGAVAIALIGAFIAREATAKTPLMPLRIFRSASVSAANGIQALSVVGMFGTFFLGALYLQGTLGYSALETGLAFLPSTLVMGVLSLRFSEPLITRFGPRGPMLSGLAMIAVGLALFARVPLHGSYIVDVFPVMVLMGAGAGTCFPALMGLAMSGVAPQDAGLASGLVNTSAQVGGALGLAVLAAVADGQAVALDGYHTAFRLGVVAVLAALAVTYLTVGRGTRKERAERRDLACEAA